MLREQVIRRHVLLCSLGGVDPKMLRTLVNTMYVQALCSRKKTGKDSELVECVCH